MFAPRPLSLSLVIFILTLSADSIAASKPNIILITLGSIRADQVGFLAAMAKQSIVFEHAYAQAPLTIVSDATILSGTYPQTHGVSELGSPLAATVSWLPELLRGRGY